MKNNRQRMILSVIKEKKIRTHEQLVEELARRGVSVTQATISRDVKELGIVKVADEEGAFYSVSADWDNPLQKFSADIIEGTDYETVKTELGEYYDILEHVGNVVEFVPKGFSKATGIKWLCDYLKLDMTDTYAIGDSVNDLDMLHVVGHGIAMGNATAQVKEIAEHVTDDIYHDGIFNALSYYNLIK